MWIWQLKCHFSKFVWIRRLKAKTANEAADELIKWLNDNGYISILACDNRGEFKGKVIEVCKQRGIKIIRGRAYHPQSQGSIKIANCIFKRRLRAVRADTGIQS
jgi:ribulose bisphosphate carboxylase small subunit